MKKLKWFLAICLVAIISTGCVKYNATMDIKKDKSMDFTIIYALDKSMMGEMSSLKEEDFAELKKTGYTVEKYTEGNFEGFKMTKKIANIDEVSTDKDVEFNLSGMMNENAENKYIFKVVKDGKKSTYYAKFKFDSNDSGLNGNTDAEASNKSGQELPDENENLLTGANDPSLITPSADSEKSSLDNMDLSGMMSSMDLSFNVNLPNAAISSNATNKENDGKKLSWKLATSGSQNIEFAFELNEGEGSSSNMLLYVGIGVGVLVLIIAIVAIVASAKKKKAVAPSAPSEEPKEEVKTEVKEEPTEHKESNE